jgi:hypothetical protein
LPKRWFSQDYGGIIKNRVRNPQRRKVMKTFITVAAAVLVVSMGSATAVAADEVVIQSGRTSQSLGAKAMYACTDAFIQELFPADARPAVRVVVPKELKHTGLVRDSRLEIGLEARQASDGVLLAKSECSVNRSARVISSTTTVPDPVKLVGLMPSNIRLAVVIR